MQWPLLQASQPDDCEDLPAFHRFPGEDSSPSGHGGLFDTPAKEPEGHQLHAAYLQQQLQALQEQRQQQLLSSHQQGRESVGGNAPPASLLSPVDTAADPAGPGVAAGVQHDAAAGVGNAAGSQARTRPPAAAAAAAGHEPAGYGQMGQDQEAQGPGVAAPALTAA